MSGFSFLGRTSDFPNLKEPKVLSVGAENFEFGTVFSFAGFCFDNGFKWSLSLGAILSFDAALYLEMNVEVGSLKARNWSVGFAIGGRAKILEQGLGWGGKVVIELKGECETGRGGSFMIA